MSVRASDAPKVNGKVSFWFDQAVHDERSALTGTHSADYVIVGGGFTGLWTAYHLAQSAPGASIVILERERIGYGASGRNAGYLSALVPGNRAKIAKRYGAQAAKNLQLRMLEAVDEVAEICSQLGIEMDARRTGNLVVARTPAASHRLQERRQGDLRWGYTEDEVQVLSASQFDDRVRVEGAVGGLYYPTAYRINPMSLVNGLARACEAAGVKIFEHSEVTRIAEGTAHTAQGQVQARVVLRCTEGYTPAIAKDRRRLIPVNSSIIMTDPLPDKVREEIGWRSAELLSDAAHVFIYSQITEDGRILLGGRGAPYRYNSGVGSDGVLDRGTTQTLVERLRDMFPATKDVPIAHAWTGVLGVTRDWSASVGFDAEQQLAWAQGYAGHGVTSAYVAAKSLAKLVLGHNDADTQLAIVNHRTKQWEPEPLRWLGVHTMYGLLGVADAREERTNAESTSLIARIAGRIAGLE